MSTIADGLGFLGLREGGMLTRLSSPTFGKLHDARLRSLTRASTVQCTCIVKYTCNWRLSLWDIKQTALSKSTVKTNIRGLFFGRHCNHLSAVVLCCQPWFGSRLFTASRGGVSTRRFVAQSPLLKRMAQMLHLMPRV